MLIKTLEVFLVRGFGAAASFLMTLIVTQVASVEQVGVFMLCLALIQVLGTVATLGAQSALIKIVASGVNGSWKRINQDQSFVFRTVFLFSSIIMLVFLIFPESLETLFREGFFEEKIYLISAGILFLAFTQILTALLNGKEQPLLGTIIQNVVSQVIFIILCFWAMIQGVSLDSVDILIIYVIGLMFSTFIGCFIWFSDERSKIVISSKLHPDLKSSISPLFIILIMGLCVQWSGQFATAHFLDAKSIALFSASQRTALLTSFVLIAVNLVVVPKFASAYARKEYVEVDRLSLFSSRLMIVLAVPVLLVMLFYPNFILSFFGEEYIQASLLLQIMAIGQFINVITGSVGFLLNMTGHERDMRNIVVFTGLMAIFLAFFLTDLYGEVGAALATAISLSCQNLLAVAVVKKRLGFNTLNLFRRIN